MKLENEASVEVPGGALNPSPCLSVGLTFLNHSKSSSNFSDAEAKSVKNRVGTEQSCL